MKAIPEEKEKDNHRKRNSHVSESEEMGNSTENMHGDERVALKQYQGKKIMKQEEDRDIYLRWRTQQYTKNKEERFT